MKFRSLFFAALVWLPVARAADPKSTEPTKEQLAGVIEAFKKISGKHQTNTDPVTEQKTHAFSLPNTTTDADIKKIPAVPFPFELSLYGASKVTDAGLKELVGQKHLRALDLSYTEVTDAGLKELKVHRGLRSLVLDNTKVTDAGTKELAAFGELHTLHVEAVAVSDAGVKEIAKLKSLRHFGVAGTEVTDAGLKELKELKELRTLRLGPAVTDAGLKELKGLTKLYALDLFETKVTDAGVKDLQTALPKCMISK